MHAAAQSMMSFYACEHILQSGHGPVCEWIAHRSLDLQTVDA